MEYMLLIYEDETILQKMTESERKSLFAAYGEYTQALEAAGVMRAGAPLQPIATSTTVRVRDGKTLPTDGPFAETREQLGGYYLVDCENLDQALEWAARIPAARFGSIEVRPVMPMDV